MDLDVIIVAYKNEATIEQLLRSLATAMEAGHRMRVFLHDNGPEAATAAHAAPVAASLGLDMTVQECSKNCGFARGCNSAVALGSAPVLLFLNPDAHVVSLPETMPDALLGAVVLDGAGRQQVTFGPRRRLRDEALLRWARRRPRVPTGAGYVSGACFLIQRQSFVQLGMFDDRYFMYYEDIDLGRRAAVAGLPVRLEEHLVIVHSGGHSAAQEASLRSMTASYESGRLFHEASESAYDLFCFVDAVLRVVYWGARRERREAEAWGRLARHVVRRGLVNRRPEVVSGGPGGPR